MGQKKKTCQKIISNSPPQPNHGRVYVMIFTFLCLFIGLYLVASKPSPFQQGEALLLSTRSYGFRDVSNPQLALRMFSDALIADPIGLCGMAKLRQGLVYWHLGQKKGAAQSLSSALMCTSPALIGEVLSEIITHYKSLNCLSRD